MAASGAVLLAQVVIGSVFHDKVFPLPPDSYVWISILYVALVGAVLAVIDFGRWGQRSFAESEDPPPDGRRTRTRVDELYPKRGL
ncbi:hypothetical protein EBS80_00605 [bacterium]|nr:hypothetical protein [bacterium]